MVKHRLNIYDSELSLNLDLDLYKVIFLIEKDKITVMRDFIFYWQVTNTINC